MRASTARQRLPAALPLQLTPENPLLTTILTSRQLTLVIRCETQAYLMRRKCILIELTRPVAVVTAAFALLLSAHSPALGQGCVAVRGGGLCLLGVHDDAGYLEGGDWQLGLNYRWLHSDRHFRGSHEEKHRQEEGTEVINDSHFFDVGIFYGISSRFSAALTIPFVHSDRSSLYEHKGNASGERYHTQAGGLGDVRLTGYAWLWDPAKMPKGNISLGVGPKFPTGDFYATDIFIRQTGPELRAVDQSIQPGDGGWGFTAEISGFVALFHRTSLYVQGGYLFNPENVNGTPTYRGNPYEAVTSIPDQYFGRVGVSYYLVPSWGLSVSLGGRIDGVPVRDAIGDSDGFRRPGYSIYVDPGISIAKNNWIFSLTGPVAVYRNRERSLADIRWTEDTGIYRHGDLASIGRKF
jgi:hypothetical protein